MTKKPQSGIGSQTRVYKATTLPYEPPPLYMLLIHQCVYMSWKCFLLLFAKT